MAQARLHGAVAVNDMELVREPLRQAPSIDLSNPRDQHMRTPLHVAVIENREQTVKSLLDNEDVDVNAIAVYDLTPLHFAARLGYIGVMRLLLDDRRTKLDAVTDDYLTAFHLVAEGDDQNSIPHLTSKRGSLKDRCEVMRMLLAEQSRRGLSGCENGQDVLGRTPLHYAALHDGCVEMIGALSFSLNVDMATSSSLDMEVPSSSHVSAPTPPSSDMEVPLPSSMDVGVEIPLSSSMDVGVPSPHFSASAPPPLDMEVTSSSSLNTDQAPPPSPLRDIKNGNILDVDGLAPLHILVIRGKKEAIKLLIQMQSVDVNVKTSMPKLHSEVAMVAFGSNPAPRCLFPLTDVQCPMELMSINMTPLHFAVKQRDIDIMELLLTKEGININDTNDEGLTPLFQSVRCGHQEVVEFLLPKVRATLQQTDTQQQTEDDVEEKVSELFTALMRLASEEIHRDVATYLLSQLQDVYKHPENGGLPDKNQLVIEMARKSHHELVPCILRWRPEDANVRDSEGCTALHYAVEMGQITMVRALLSEKGWRVNATIGDNFGYTPVAYTLLERAKGCIDIQNLLMDRPEVKDFVERQDTWQLQMASTMLVVNTLIAGVTYVCWMQPPLGFNNYEDYNGQQYGYNIPANSAPTPSDTVTTFRRSEALSHFYAYNCLAFVFALTSMIQIVSYIAFSVHLSTDVPSAQRISKRILHSLLERKVFFSFFLSLPFCSSLSLVLAFYHAGYTCEPQLMKILRFSFLFIVVRFVIEGFSVARKMASWRRPRKELRILELQVTVRHMWYEWFRSLAYGG
jgi:ankyrin repeat protein